MKTRCPSCGATLSLDALVQHDAARQAMVAAFALGNEIGGALIRYLALHRPEQRELTMDRVARLLGDLLPDIKAQRIERDGRVYDAPPEAWVWAIEQAITSRDAGRLKTPLRGHGWLYEVLTHWKPSVGGVMRGVATEPTNINSPAARSQTMKAIAELEGMKRGANRTA
ncbi:MAG: hypothetical protein FWC38_00465 [Proteobacteria bacterium]|nr:hypothetical protein [Pseudomonadota bacterium]MCL2306715.1 hypothetical protein [Pseudomonadota bacterium]